MRAPEGPRLPVRHLLLGTSSFAICFAGWGLIAGFAPAFRRELGLTAAQTSLLVVVQMWLLTASLETFLGGHREVAGPAAAVSALLFAACGALFLFVRRMAARTRRAMDDTSR